GFHETVPDNVLRSQTDAGPAKLRRRSTSGVRGLTLAYMLSKAEVAALESFYLDTLAGGIVSFTLAHPRTGGNVTCRFKKPPAYVALNGAVFRAGLELEVLP